MFCLEIHVFAEMASFRIPETHTFQQSLSLPPLTALIGMVGAAGGFSFADAMKFCYEENQLSFGVVGTNNGRVRDLWKYRKIKSDEVISAVLLREYLIDLDLWIYILSEDKMLVNQIRNYFLDPRYVLTAGNSDLLYKIKSISQLLSIAPEQVNDFKDTIIPGNQADNYESNIDLKKIPLMRDIYAPTVQLLPTEFEFFGEERRVKNRKLFTFVNTPILLRQPVIGFRINGRSVALI
jgi:CRISPR-associated protein Cas5t